MLAFCIACHCAMQKARLKSDGYTCRTVRRRLADAGSNPASSTISAKPNCSQLGFSFAQLMAAQCVPRASNTMEFVTFLIDFVLHVDKYLEAFVQNY